MSKSEIRVPRRVGMDQLNRILMGYLRAGADTESVSYKEAAEISGVFETTVSLNNGFLVSSGFLRQEKQRSFILTENGIKYARFISWGRLEDAREPLQAIVNEYPLFKKVTDYVRINVSVMRDDLISRIAAITGVPKKKGYEKGMNTVIDLLLFSGMLKEEDGTITIVEEKVEEPIERVSVIPKKESVTFGRHVAFPINITINVNENTSKGKFKQFMQIIKEVFSDQQEE